MEVINALGINVTVGSCTLNLVSVGAPGVESLGMLDATVLANNTHTTGLPTTLKRVPDISFTAKFVPSDMAGIIAEINTNQAITFDYSGIGAGTYGTDTVWGFLSSFVPNEASFGEDVWEATGTIMVTNQNGSFVETPPSYS